MTLSHFQNIVRKGGFLVWWQSYTIHTDDLPYSKEVRDSIRVLEATRRLNTLVRERGYSGSEEIYSEDEMLRIGGFPSKEELIELETIIDLCNQYQYAILRVRGFCEHHHLFPHFLSEKLERANLAQIEKILESVIDVDLSGNNSQVIQGLRDAISLLGEGIYIMAHLRW